VKYRYRAYVLAKLIYLVGFERACRWAKAWGWVSSWSRDEVWLAR
jgi:hypothetical protein